MVVFLKIVASFFALALLLLHQFHPRIDVDTVSLILIVLIFVPWFLQYVKEIEIGGVKIDLDQLMSATRKIDLSATPATANLLLKGHAPTVKVSGGDETWIALSAIAETHPN
jgi:hypothetical protein